MIKRVSLIITLLSSSFLALGSNFDKINPSFVFHSDIRFTAQIDYKEGLDLSKTATLSIVSDTGGISADWTQVPKLKAKEVFEENLYKIIGTPFTLRKDLITKAKFEKKTSALVVQSNYNFNLLQNSRKVLLNIERKGQSPIESFKAPHHDMKIYYPDTQEKYENFKSKHNARQLLVLHLGKKKKMSLLKIRKGTLKIIFSGMSQVEAFAFALSTL